MHTYSFLILANATQGTYPNKFWNIQVARDNFLLWNLFMHTDWFQSPLLIVSSWVFAGKIRSM